MKPKLTKWFPADTKPTIPGVYDVRAPGEKYQCGAQYWSGHAWSYWGFNREDAARCACYGKSAFQTNEWRGLAKDPAKESA